MAGDPYSFAESGPTQAAGYVQAQNLNNLAMQKTQAETTHYQALAQQEMQKAALEKQQAETQQMQQVQMQRIALMHKGESLADQTKAQIEGGFLMGSIKSSLEASQTLNQLAQTSNHLAQAEGKQAEDAAKKFELLGRVAKNTNTQEDFEKNIKILEGTGVKVPDAIKNASWTPEIKQRLIDLSENQIKEREEKLKENDEIRKEDTSKQQILVEKARVDLVKAQTAEAWAKTEKEKKVGGDKVLRAPPEDRQLAADLIGNKFPEVLDSKKKIKDRGAAAMADIIADNAQELHRNRPGLTRAQAVQLAFDAAGPAMEVTITQQKETHFYGDTPEKRKVSFDPAKAAGVSESKPAAPAPTAKPTPAAAKETGLGTFEKPIQMKTDADYDSVKKGQYFIDPTGKRRQRMQD